MSYINTEEEKNKNRDCCVCTRVLPLVKCTRPLADSIPPSSHASHFHSPFLPPPPPPRVWPVLPLYLLYLFGICLTNTSPIPHSPYPPIPTPPHDLISHPCHLALPFIHHQFKLNHSHGCFKHHIYHLESLEHRKKITTIQHCDRAINIKPLCCHYACIHVANILMWTGTRERVHTHKLSLSLSLSVPFVCPPWPFIPFSFCRWQRASASPIRADASQLHCTPLVGKF